MTPTQTVHLYLNDLNVGVVKLRGFDTSWGYGNFEPAEEFARFATYFGNWSLLMHADDGEPRMSRAAHEELRAAENALDALRARLHLVDEGKWVEIAQVNIDGPLIEFKMR